ncbi:hypothetical protein GW931_00915 [archaeon]|nr:hypothetical protein [archaeon]PJC45646.1 MAG: hypothetical protein CO037_00345 [Candidatus Pacearchaeota archaeon CG_4_9_14_0_2_um_filter_30_8]
METSNYINALKTKNLKEIKIATSNREELKKGQEGKCSKCKQELRPGYFKFIKNIQTGRMDAVCSDCLVHIPERK